MISWKWTDEWRERLPVSSAIGWPSKMSAIEFSNVKVSGDINRSSFGGVIVTKGKHKWSMFKGNQEEGN